MGVVAPDPTTEEDPRANVAVAVPAIEGTVKDPVISAVPFTVSVVPEVPQRIAAEILPISKLPAPSPQIPEFAVALLMMPSQK